MSRKTSESVFGRGHDERLGTLANGEENELEPLEPENMSETQNKALMEKSDCCAKAEGKAKELTAKAEEKLAELRDNAQQWLEHCESEVQERPGRTLAAAVAAGYLLNQLPLRSIIGANLRVVSAVLPPVLFVYGAAKLYEFVKAQQHPSA